MWSPNITLLLRAVLPEYHLVYVICNQQILFVSVLFTITVLKIRRSFEDYAKSDFD